MVRFWSGCQAVWSNNGWHLSISTWHFGKLWPRLRPTVGQQQSASWTYAHSSQASTWQFSGRHSSHRGAIYYLHVNAGWDSSCMSAGHRSSSYEISLSLVRSQVSPIHEFSNAVPATACSRLRQQVPLKFLYGWTIPSILHLLPVNAHRQVRSTIIWWQLKLWWQLMH